MLKFALIPPGPPAGIRKRDFNAAKKIAFEKIGEYWFEFFLPKHFTKAGAREYGYTPRKGENLPRGSKAWRKSYTGKKWKKYGVTQPLVYTGESKRATRSARIKTTSKKVTVTMRTPRLNWRAKNSEINMNKELTTISPAEWNVLTGIFEQRLEHELSKIAQTGR